MFHTNLPVTNTMQSAGFLAEQLDPELFTIGCHTGRHPILPSLRDADLDEEIVQSKLRIEERLVKSVDFFCYPNGDFDGKRQTEPPLIPGS